MAGYAFKQLSGISVSGIDVLLIMSEYPLMHDWFVKLALAMLLICLSWEKKLLSKICFMKLIIWLEIFFTVIGLVECKLGQITQPQLDTQKTHRLASTSSPTTHAPCHAPPMHNPCTDPYTDPCTAQLAHQPNPLLTYCKGILQMLLLLLISWLHFLAWQMFDWSVAQPQQTLCLELDSPWSSTMYS